MLNLLRSVLKLAITWTVKGNMSSGKFWTELYQVVPPMVVIGNKADFTNSDVTRFGCSISRIYLYLDYSDNGFTPEKCSNESTEPLFKSQSDYSADLHSKQTTLLKVSQPTPLMIMM